MLTLAAGQNGLLLCAFDCGAPPAASGRCDHGDPLATAKLTGSDTCASVVLDNPALLREELRRGSSSPDAGPALTARSALVSPAPVSVGPHDAASARAPQERPLTVVLRI